MENFVLKEDTIQANLKSLATKDKKLAAAIDQVGFPAERISPQGFMVLLRVIVGQQLSVKAAATIWGRVEALGGDNATPADYARLTDEALRTAGLSRQKISYFRSLCEEVTSGKLDVEGLADMSNDAAIEAITSVKGLGVWSAHMYLMFSLGRADIWPVGDLAVRIGAARIVGGPERPSEKQAQEIGERWRPYRSSVALLAWHFYANAPL